MEQLLDEGLDPAVLKDAVENRGKGLFVLDVENGPRGVPGPGVGVLFQPRHCFPQKGLDLFLGVVHGGHVE